MEIMVNWYRTLPVIGRFHDKLKLARKERDGALRDLTEARDQFSRLHKEIETLQYTVELRYRDLMIAIGYDGSFIPAAKALLRTSHPLAADLNDHLYPRGTKNDNTRLPRFVFACEKRFGRPLTYVDLGCAGGGLVLDFILRGHTAYGIEGSDYSKLAQRAEWRLLRDNLFTADITKPFELVTETNAQRIACDVISAWEVMEHLPDVGISAVLANVRLHLKDDGIFIGSIATYRDQDSLYHQTVMPQAWWKARFEQEGFKMIDEHGFAFEDFCRGTGNGPLDPNFRTLPNVGFHFVALVKGAT